MFQIVVTEIEPNAKFPDVPGIVRLQMTVDRIDMAALMNVLNNPPAAPRKRRKDAGTTR